MFIIKVYSYYATDSSIQNYSKMFLIFIFIYFFQIELQNCNASGSDFRFKILGGEETEIVIHPYMVNIIKIEHDDFIECRFGGTIINNKWILTAAHSTYAIINDNNKDKYFVIAGSTSCYNIEEGGQILPIHDIIIHPEYKFDTKSTHTNFDNNIAVIELEKELIFNPKVQPVQLAFSSESNFTLPIENNVQCESMGWGVLGEDVNSTTPGLLVVKLSLIPNDLCVELISNFNLTLNVSTSFCTLDSQGKKGVCFGDSGGPLMCNNYQVGIASGDINCSSKYSPVIWIRVDVYYDWIQSVIKPRLFKSKTFRNNTNNIVPNFLLVILIVFYSYQN